MKSMRGNYLSSEYQINLINSFDSNLRPQLIAFIESKSGITQPGKTMDELQDKKVSNKQCIQSLCENIDTIKILYIAELTNGESKDSHSLMQYFASLETLLTQAVRMLLKTDSRKFFFNICTMINFLINKITECQKHKVYLQHAVDINVYKVVIPREEYKKILDGSESFEVGGRAKTAAIITGGITAEIVYIPTAMLGVGSLLAGVTAAPASIPFFLAGGVACLISSALNVELFNKIPRGYSCKIGISPLWIKGRVKSDGTMEANPNYFNDDDKTSVMYVLDANNPEKVWREGVQYVGLEKDSFFNNSRGNLVFFEYRRHALECAKLRENGLLYDKNGGWRRYHAWTESQRAEIVMGREEVKAAIANTNLIPPLVNIVGEYLGFSPSRCKKM